MGVALRHPNGGPPLALRLDPARAAAAAGFDYFAIGVPDHAAIEALAARRSELGEEHAGVHPSTTPTIRRTPSRRSTTPARPRNGGPRRLAADLSCARSVNAPR